MDINGASLFLQSASCSLQPPGFELGYLQRGCCVAFDRNMTSWLSNSLLQNADSVS